jgi:hypothetical protein
VIERHFRQAVDPGLVGPGFLATVVDGKNFAPDWFSNGLVEKGLRVREGREQQRANYQRD